MSIFTLFTFVGGVGLFLFGMNVMGEAIGRRAGGKLKIVLEKITSNKVMGVLLGTAVTAVIQSSSATTVMIIGFINSGIMSLSNAIGPILGANIGTTATAWILALNDISGSSIVLQLLNPDSFVPLLAFAGAVMLVFCKNDRTKDIGIILLGFAVLMFGMDTMSGAMSPLRDSPVFKKILVALANPFLGVLAGAAMAAVLQSSSASVGIIQAAAITGVVSVDNCLPLIMGINIGAGVIVLIASVGTVNDAKRAAWVYMLHNVISTIIYLIPLTILHVIGVPDFMEKSITSFDIAILHTVYKASNTVLQLPFFRQIIWMTERIVHNSQQEQEFELLDENFLKTPSLAVARCGELTNNMAELAKSAVYTAIDVVRKFDPNQAEVVNNLETEIDILEGKIGNFLVKISASKLTEQDSRAVTRMLHSISDLERMSDHAKNIMESGQELEAKGISFSNEAREELEVIFSAVQEAVDYAVQAFVNCDVEIAGRVDPLEQVVDDLKDALRNRHIERLRMGTCSTTLGFVFTDILTDLERISDHCSNIVLSVLQQNQELEAHRYEEDLKFNDAQFAELYKEYQKKYSLG